MMGNIVCDRGSAYIVVCGGADSFAIHGRTGFEATLEPAPGDVLLI